MREGRENAGKMRIWNGWKKKVLRIKVVNGVITGLTRTERSHLAL